MNGTRKCPRGFIRRKGYTRKNTGKYVHSSCIRSTSPHGKKATNTTIRQKQRMGRLLGTRKRCPPGQIARSAYVRRVSKNVAKAGFNKTTRSGKRIHVFPKSKSVFVPASCVKDLGKKGKGERIFPALRKGLLSKHGYQYNFPEDVRRKALEKAIGEYGALSTYRKLNAVAKLSVRSNPKASSAFAADRNWIRSSYSVNGEMKAF